MEKTPETPTVPADHRLFYTTASERYDRGTTIDLGPTLFRFVKSSGELVPLRAIAIPNDDRLVEDQKGRNGSGLHPTWEVGPELEEELRWKTVIVAP